MRKLVVPIEVMADNQRPTDHEFAVLAYDVMASAFAVHNEIGRFCDEKTTALYENQPQFEQHARRFLEHTKLPAIHWINITRQLVRIETLERSS